MKRVCVLFLMLASSVFGLTYSCKNGETAPRLEILLLVKATGAEKTGATITDLHFHWKESGAATVSSTDITALATLDAAYGGADPNVCKAIEIGEGMYQLDIPPTCVNMGVGKRTTFWVTDGTNKAMGLITLSPQGDIVTVNGNAPLTAAAITTNIMQDTTAGNYNVDGSFGENLKTGTAAPGEAGGLAIVGSEMGLSDDAITNGKMADSAALEIADRVAGLIGSDPNIVEDMAQATVGLQGIIPPPPSGEAIFSGSVSSYQETVTGSKLIYRFILAAGASGTDDIYNGKNITINKFGGGRVTTNIVDYEGSTRLVSIWPYIGSVLFLGGTATYEITEAVPVSTSSAAILTGTARAGLAGSIQLADTSVGVPETANDVYNGYSVRIISGTGVGQIRKIIDYQGHSATPAADNLAFISPDWTTIPDTTSVYEILLGAVYLEASSVSAGAPAVWWNYNITDSTAGSAGAYLNSLYDQEAWIDIATTNTIVSGTKNTIVLTSTDVISGYSPVYCPFKFIDATNSKQYFGIILGYDATSYTLRLFPSLDVVPVAGDSFYIKPEMLTIPPRSGYFPG